MSRSRGASWRKKSKTQPMKLDVHKESLMRRASTYSSIFCELLKVSYINVIDLLLPPALQSLRSEKHKKFPAPVIDGNKNKILSRRRRSHKKLLQNIALLRRTGIIPLKLFLPKPDRTQSKVEQLLNWSNKQWIMLANNVTRNNIKKSRANSS